MFGSIGLPEIILILVVAILIFGVGRISKIGGELGSGIRAFKEGLAGDKANEKKETPPENEKSDSSD